MDIPSAKLETITVILVDGVWTKLVEADSTEQKSVEGFGHNWSAETATVQSVRALEDADIATLVATTEMEVEKSSAFKVTRFMLKAGEALFVRSVQDTPANTNVAFEMNVVVEPAGAA